MKSFPKHHWKLSLRAEGLRGVKCGPSLSVLVQGKKKLDWPFATGELH